MISMTEPQWARCLRVSTKHVPKDTDLRELDHWGHRYHWGETTWFFCYEDRDDEEIVPNWLFDIMLKARDIYGAEWIQFYDNAEVYDCFSVYQ
tara:strand:- start:585 stop:863 length:279 start_codon:yes stop_codon:yes gene_type:complete